MSTQDDVFNEIQFDPEYKEERFRVDRKKLEQMLQTEIQIIPISCSNENTKSNSKCSSINDTLILLYTILYVG